MPSVALQQTIDEVLGMAVSPHFGCQQGDFFGSPLAHGGPLKGGCQLQDS